MPWFFIQDPPLDGVVNMARDEWLLQRAAKEQLGFLRLYQWEKPTLTLGRGQRTEHEVDERACAALKIPLVRRNTGGRAVLHGNDWTYSVCAPRDAFGSVQTGGVMAIYQHISQAFVHFFQSLGLQPQTHQTSRAQRAELASAVCFMTPSAFEIMHDGRKLVGSAQRLLPKAFLQHGSIPLSPQNTQLARLFINAQAQEIAQHMTDLQSLGVEKTLAHQQLPHLLMTSFESVFQVQFTPYTWSAADLEASEKLVVQRQQQLPAPTANPSINTLSPR